MVRFVLLLVLFIVVARVFWRVVDNVIEAASGQTPGARGGAPQRGVPMARDPVCGTFVVRERALWLGDGQSRVYFCSDACRDAYRRGDRSGSAAHDAAKGRTA